MSQDPFARFESSRGGWLIPIGLFVVGAIVTTVAINVLHHLDVPAQENVVQPVNAANPNEVAPAALPNEPIREPSRELDPEPVTETAEPEYS